MSHLPPDASFTRLKSRWECADQEAMNVQIALGIALAFSLSQPEIEAPQVQPRVVRLAIVMPQGADEEARLCRQVEMRLAALMRLEARQEVVVASENVGIAEASARLHLRRCDAVIVLGSTRPAALRDGGTVAYAASLGPDYGFRPAYLLVHAEDRLPQGGLVSVFPQAMRTLGR